MVADRKCITDTTLYKRGEWIKLKIKVSENIVKDRDNILKKQSKFKSFHSHRCLGINLKDLILVKPKN